MERVLKRLEPSKEERKEIHALAERVISHIASKGYPAELMGSVAKDTWLSEQADLDVFVFFDPKIKRGVLEKEALKIGEQTFKELGGSFEVGYAEHPYVRGNIAGIKIDIVPCYRLKKAELKSSVDRTPFHTKYVKSHLTKELRKHVLLLKQFMKAHEVYGAEAKVEGFSGYLCELLILKYRTFEKVLKASEKWPQIIDLESYYKPAQHKVMEQVFKSPFIVIDPVDKERNVAAALTEENLERFKRGAKEYLKKSSIEHFFPKPVEPLPIDKVKAKTKNCIYIVIEKPKIVDDVLWPQMRRSAGILKTQLELNDFKVKRTEVWADEKCILILWLDRLELPKTRMHMGPPVKIEEHAEKFRKKYPKARVNKGRLQVKVKREFFEAEKLVKHLLKKGYLASRLAEMGPKVVKSDKIERLYREGFSVWLTKELTRV